jgi:hypothetical protein
MEHVFVSGEDEDFDGFFRVAGRKSKDGEQGKRK